MSNATYSTKELNVRIKRRFRGRTVSGAGVLCDIRDAINHEAETGDWTCMTLMLTASGDSESKRIKRVFNALGITFKSCKKSAQGLRAIMPKGDECKNAVDKLSILLELCKREVSFDSRVLATGIDAGTVDGVEPLFAPAVKADWKMASLTKQVALGLDAGHSEGEIVAAVIGAIRAAREV